MKAASKNKTGTETKRASARCPSQAEDEATRTARFCSAAQATAESRLTCKDKAVLIPCLGLEKRPMLVPGSAMEKDW